MDEEPLNRGGSFLLILRTEEPHYPNFYYTDIRITDML